LASKLLAGAPLGQKKFELGPERPAPIVVAELARPDMPIEEAVYWRGYALSLYVDNQETWQRVKGGDHVRRMEIVGPDDADTCEHCRSFLGKQFLVARVPELPHRTACALNFFNASFSIFSVWAASSSSPFTNSKNF